jgi:hypothetical protein
MSRTIARSNQEPDDKFLEEQIKELETFRGKSYGNAYEALVAQFGEKGEAGTFVCFVACKGEKPAIMTNTDSDTARKLARKLMRLETRSIRLRMAKPGKKQP